ncbi:MAG: hypothetical protein LBK04_04425 [Clostridiales Family XIII bacterium]|jgi:putative membrane fusion protein|nr:hypothetical protein [Clostridiales Family XIII bacterium]
MTCVTVFLVVVAILCVLVYGLPWSGKALIKTELLDEEGLLISDEQEALFVREETLYLAWADGAPGYPVKEGTKIRQGMQVYSINTEAPVPEEYGKAKADAAKKDEEASSETSDEDPIQDRFSAILGKSAGSAVVSPGGVSEMTAIISYYADGFEKQISPQTIDSLDQGILEEIPAETESLERSYVFSGEPIYRIVDNNEWYIIVWAAKDEYQSENYAEGKQVRIDLGSTEVKAVIDRVADRGDTYMVVIKSDMYYKDLSKFRRKKVNVVFEEYAGPLVGEKAIIKQDGADGVYAKQKDGSFKWVPVKIVRSYGGEALIAEDYYYDEDGQRVETVVYYDEIMSDPAGEGYKAD